MGKPQWDQMRREVISIEERGLKRNSRQTDNLSSIMKGYSVSRESHIIQNGRQ